MIEKIEQFLEEMKLEGLPLQELKCYTETVIMLEQFKISKEITKKIDKIPLMDLKTL